MSTEFGFSKEECEVIQAQIQRRMMYRCEFMKARTDPCKHAQEAGYVFDPAVQRFLSLKTTQFQRFTPTPGSVFTTLAMIVPIVAYGYLLWSDRNETEMQIRCGCLRYKDRLFKFC